MTNYIWTDNPTKSGVAVCNTDILNECLMHLKYNAQSGGSSVTPFCVNSGNTDLNGDGDLIGTNIVSQTINYVQPVLRDNGTPGESPLAVRWMKNGGSNLGYPYNTDSTRAPYKLFDGQTTQSSYINLGYANELKIYFNEPICLTGFEQLFPDDSHTYSGEVKVWSRTQNSWVALCNFSKLSENNKIVVTFNNEEKYDTYRICYLSSNYTINNDSCLPLAEVNLQGRIVDGSYGSNLFFKVGGEYPALSATDVSGNAVVRSSIPAKDVSELADGSYNIFVGADGEEYSSNTIYRQKSIPDAVTGDIWLDTSVEPLNAYMACEASYGILSDVIGYNKVLAKSFSTFKSSKITIDGSSSYLSDGTASFTGGAVNVSYNFNPGTNSYSCSFNSVVTSEFLSYTQTSQYFLNSDVANTAFVVEYSPESGGRIITGFSILNTDASETQTLTLTLDAPSENLEVGDVIGLDLGYDAAQGSYYAKYFVNGVLTDNVSVQSAYYTAGGSTKFYIGNSVPGNAGYLRASVDLKTFRLRVNGEITINCNDSGTDTVGNISVPYILTAEGEKIVDGYYRGRVQDVFNANGSANYYTLDVSAKNYSLPAVSSWQQYDKVPIGSAVVSSGLIQSYETFPFNQNGYHKNVYSS